MTEKQEAMLRAADACSFPGDGLRIKGPGAHRVARGLEEGGYVRVARPMDAKARVHITAYGRGMLRLRDTGKALRS
jgi:hypothetical protein